MHILVLSRFNCVQRHVTSERAKKRMEIRRFDEGWMARRLKLMQHFTAPSIKSQTDINFSWHVFIQKGTPRWVIYELKKIGCNVVTVDTDDVGAAQALVRSRRGTIATVNLDTDDAIHPTFLERFRVEAKPRNETFVFLRGYRYRTIPQWAVSTKDKSNPFVCRVDKYAEKAETAFEKVKAVRVLDTSFPMWVRTVHDENMNQIKLRRTNKDVNQSRELLLTFDITPIPYYGRP
jgi:hypothetical protein